MQGQNGDEHVSSGGEVPGSLTASQVLADFRQWLAPRRLAERSRGTYLQRAARFCAFLEQCTDSGVDRDLAGVLSDGHSLSYAGRDWRRHLLTVDKAPPSTVNVSLAALAALGESRGLGRFEVDRVEQVRRAPAALSDQQARDLLRAAQRTAPREHALVALLLATGLRISEAAALDVDDVPTTARTGQVMVRAGKGAKPRVVPLTGRALAAVRSWLHDSRQDGRGLTTTPTTRDPALWLGRNGRLSVRQLQRSLSLVGGAAGMEHFTAHQLRHTAATRWLRAGVDVVTVAELLGHADLETTRLYTRPTHADLAAAVAGVELDY